MCNISYCDNCNKRMICNGYVVDIYTYLYDKICKYYRETMSSRFWSEFEFFIQETVDAAFFELFKVFTLNNGEKKYYLEFLREEYQNEALRSNEASYNAVYKKRRRYLKKLAEHQKKPVGDFQKITKEWFQLLEFSFRYRYNRRVRNEKEYDKKLLEHNRGFNLDLFSVMFEYKMPSGHKISIKDIRDDLKSIENIYNDIEKNCKTYFDKCLRYQFVEHFLHFETAYKFVKCLEDFGEICDAEVKYKILQYEAMLRLVNIPENKTNKEHPLYFSVIVNLELWLELFFIECFSNYSKTGDVIRPEKCQRFLVDIALIKEWAIKSFEKVGIGYPKWRISECAFAEEIFRRYMGEGQHIIKNKDLNNNVVKDIRDIFDKCERID